MQPTHATSDMPWAEARIGAERVQGAYAWRTMLADRRRTSPSASDFPVEEVPPLERPLRGGDARGQRRQTAAAAGTPSERLTLDEALRGYTVEAAYAAFQEAHRGRIAPGFVADLTVYDRELLPDHLLDVRIAMTIVGGNIVYGD